MMCSICTYNRYTKCLVRLMSSNSVSTFKMLKFTNSQNKLKRAIFSDSHGYQILYSPLPNLGQYDRPRVIGCEPVDGVLVVLSSN